jgi:hypothetical protein
VLLVEIIQIFIVKKKAPWLRSYLFMLIEESFFIDL